MGRDDSQYVEFVTGQLPVLRRTAYLMCGDWHRADDLVQITITRLHIHWRAVRTAATPAAYARKVLVRVFLDDRRHSWTTRVDLHGSLTDRPDPRSAAGTAPGTAAEAVVDDRLELREALSRIPPRQRAVLVLRYFSDLSVEDTAAALRCSPGTVKSQTARGLAALRATWSSDHSREGTTP